MRMVFMGTPAFAVPVLSSLADAGHEILAVYTQPDRPAGRGKRLAPSPVKQHAAEHGWEVRQPRSLRRDEAQRDLASLQPEVIIVAAYGLFLPVLVLQLPLLGCLNVHPSLLPRYRGPSPVAVPILNGDEVTGATVIKLDKGMDTGPVIAAKETAIGPEENAQELTARLFEIGASLLVEVLPAWASGDVQAAPQDESKATVTKLLSREDGEIDWSVDADQISRQVRAYHPWPGSFTHWRGKLLKIMEASVPAADEGPRATPGTVMQLPSRAVGIATGDGALEPRTLQIAGGRALSAKDFLQGHPELVGSKVGRATTDI